MTLNLETKLIASAGAYAVGVLMLYMMVIANSVLPSVFAVTAIASFAVLMGLVYTFYRTEKHHRLMFYL
jgi:hypothetical protein